ncbi:DUF4349 domain-containing protein [Kitasatospora sp. NPDC004723]|uniref:DUF4349 domain-containing protein n=1 Tax=Kitasatospora sp. NPDC004723 TaxID=3154288 RepID=UPI0033B806B4
MAVTAALAAGCSAGSGDGAADRAAAAPAQAAAGEAAKGDAPLGGPGSAASAAAPQAAATGQPAAAPVVDARQIAYSAQLTVWVAKVDETLDRARALALAAGGYVASETASGTGTGTGGEPTATGVQSGQLTVKVPSAAFQQTLDQLAALGEVVSRRSQAEDLTQQVADVNSRMQSQQASVDRVRALMAQAKSLSEIVSLESELSRREADLESLQKQVKELSARTSLSTVTLDVRPKPSTAQPEAPAPEEDDGFWAEVGSALGGGWHVLFLIVRGLFVAVAALLPFLLVVVPVAAAVWVVRRRWVRTARERGRDRDREPIPGFAPPPPSSPPGAEQEPGREPARDDEQDQDQESRTP